MVARVIIIRLSLTGLHFRIAVDVTNTTVEKNGVIHLTYTATTNERYIGKQSYELHAIVDPNVMTFECMLNGQLFGLLSGRNRCITLSHS